MGNICYCISVNIYHPPESCKGSRRIPEPHSWFSAVIITCQIEYMIKKKLMFPGSGGWEVKYEGREGLWERKRSQVETSTQFQVLIIRERILRWDKARR
jgi:hypothetical protein